MSFTLLRTAQDWKQYSATQATTHGIPPTLLEVGQGPTHYPCLVASHYQNFGRPAKLINCYVYPQDIVPLLQATGMSAGEGALAALAPAPAAAPDQTLLQFWRESSAHLLTIAYWLTKTGICTQQQYEQAYAAKLALLDQVETEKLSEYLGDLPGKCDEGGAGEDPPEPDNESPV